jgi:hypothetical protein
MPKKAPTAAPAAKAEAAPAAERKTTAGTTQPKFKWAGTADGRVAKALICIIGEAGTTKAKDLHAAVTTLMPTLAPTYEAATGKPLTASMVAGRWQYMYFTAAQRNDGVAITGEKSSEHPDNTKNASFAETYARVVEGKVVDGKPLTAKQVAELGAEAVVEETEEA